VYQIYRKAVTELSPGCVSDLPQSGYRTQPGVEALRNPGYRILDIDRSEGAKENTRARHLSSLSNAKRLFMTLRSD
jgi:hypothetical protein